jgi:hypothetical protein
LSSGGKSRNDEQSFRYRRRRFIGANLVDRLLQSNVAVRGGTTSLPAKNHSENARKLLWASVREMLNIFKQLIAVATSSVPHDILAKLMKLGGMDLVELSLGTVRMFHQDAVAAGFRL